MVTIDDVEYFDTTEFATLAGVTPARAWQWASRGLIPSFRRGGRKRLFYRCDDVKAFLAMEQVEVKPEARAKRTKAQAGKATRLASKRVSAWSKLER